MSLIAEKMVHKLFQLQKLFCYGRSSNSFLTPDLESVIEISFYDSLYEKFLNNIIEQSCLDKNKNSLREKITYGVYP